MSFKKLNFTKSENNTTLSPFILLRLDRILIVIFLLLCNLFFSPLKVFATDLSPTGVNQCAAENIKLRIYKVNGSKPSTKVAIGAPAFIPEYQVFVAEIVEYITELLDKEIACQQGKVIPEEISLVFVEHYIYLKKSSRWGLKNTPPKNGRLPINNLSCQLISPWLQMNIQHFPTLKVEAIVNWSGRQMLIDQALLAKPSLADNFSKKLLDRDLLQQYLSEYSQLQKQLGEKPTSDTAKNIPEDVLWFYRQIVRENSGGLAGERNPLSGGIRLLFNNGAAGYTNIVKALINQCFDSQNNALQDYKTIFDLSKIEKHVNIDDYQIKSLRRK